MIFFTEQTWNQSQADKIRPWSTQPWSRRLAVQRYLLRLWRHAGGPGDDQDVCGGSGPGQGDRSGGQADQREQQVGEDRPGAAAAEGPRSLQPGSMNA